jgi:hypothetical protein
MDEMYGSVWCSSPDTMFDETILELKGSFEWPHASREGSERTISMAFRSNTQRNAAHVKQWLSELEVPVPWVCVQLATERGRSTYSTQAIFKKQ